MDQKTCSCGQPFTPNSWKQERCNTCRFAPHPRARKKLNAQDVVVIRQRILAGDRPVDIARDYNVHPSNITHIAHRKHWRYVA